MWDKIFCAPQFHTEAQLIWRDNLYCFILLLPCCSRFWHCCKFPVYHSAWIDHQTKKNLWIKYKMIPLCKKELLNFSSQLNQVQNDWCEISGLLFTLFTSQTSVFHCMKTFQSICTTSKQNKEYPIGLQVLKIWIQQCIMVPIVALLQVSSPASSIPHPPQKKS